MTVDFCDDAGTFLGGCIAPGAAAMAASVRAAAPALPQVRVRGTGDAFGRDTESAINAGIVHAIRGLVRQSVEAHAMTLTTWPEVIATGGDAMELFAGHDEGDEPFELIHAVSRDLTLYGIALAYVEHHVKHRS